MKKQEIKKHEIVRIRHIASIIARKISKKEIAAEEDAILQIWLNESSRNRQRYDKIASQSERGFGELMDGFENVHSSNEKLFDKIRQYSKKQLMLKRMLVSSGVAAVLVILFLSLPTAVNLEMVPTPIDEISDTVVYMITQRGQKININEHPNGVKEVIDGRQFENKISDNEMITIVVPLQRNFKLTLSDSSEVWLNAGSKISYPVNFGNKNRVVEISGEAYFEVHKDATRPFVVKSNHIVTEVLGTRFLVTSYPNSETKKVSLVEGSVKVSSDFMDENIVLRPGFGVRFNSVSRNFKEELTDLDEIASLKEHKFIFKGKKLSEIMSSISAWYGVNVIYENEEMKELEFYIITNRYETIDELMQLIKCTNNINYELKEKNLFIRK